MRTALFGSLILSIRKRKRSKKRKNHLLSTKFRMPPKERKLGCNFSFSFFSLIYVSTNELTDFSTKALESSLQKLSVEPTASTRPAATTAKPASKNKLRSFSSSSPPPLVDSWEEEAALSLSSGSSSRASSPNPAHPQPPLTPTSPLSKFPLAPPSTPITGTHHDDWTGSSTHVARSSQGVGGTGYHQQAPPQARPEKQTAVAGRMIAGALGVRAPPKSEEGTRYERVLREKAGREREGKKRQDEERERAKKAVWDS